jgi:hypothetical protein
MADPLKLAAAVIEFGLARHGLSETRRTATWVVLIVVSVACASAAGGFAVTALLICLIPIVGVASAALVVAGTLSALAAIAAGVSQYLSRPSRRHEVAPLPDLGSLVADAEGFVRDNKALTLAAAFIAGVLTADETSRSRPR